MKVKVGNTEICGVLSNVAKIKDEWHCIITRRDGSSYAYKFNFEPIQIQDTPQIEVGSEWVATLAKQGEKTLVVLHVGRQMSLCKWVADNREFSIKNTEFNTAYKPKPKTVTMYFYKDGVGYRAFTVPLARSELLFTKEIEL